MNAILQRLSREVRLTASGFQEAVLAVSERVNRRVQILRLHCQAASLHRQIAEAHRVTGIALCDFPQVLHDTPEHFQHEIDGSGGEFLYMPAGGSRCPATHESVDAKRHFVHQDGRQVYRYAVSKMTEICETLMQRNGLAVDDIDLLIPHQANARIITCVAERLGLPLEKTVINIQDYGNTTGGTIPLATRDALTQGRLKRGDLVLMAAVGAGLTAGGALWRWSC